MSAIFYLTHKHLYKTNPNEGTTQGDNLAMSFYALPLLNALRLTSPNVSQVCLADDFTGAGKLITLRKWWDTIVTQGSKFGYYVNQRYLHDQSKSWINIKTKKI